MELSRGDGSTGQMPQTLTGLLEQPPPGPGGREATLPNEQAPQEGSSGPRKATVPAHPGTPPLWALVPGALPIHRRGTESAP